MTEDLRREIEYLITNNPLTLSDIFQKSSSTSYTDITRALESL